MGKIGSGLSGLTKLLAGLATADFAKSVLDTADAMQSINSQVRQVTSSETEYLVVQQQLSIRQTVPVHRLNQRQTCTFPQAAR
ncbi:hypothetical protein ND436_002780 [Neisseria gonorrhoeae]|nr:hypothetical protein [Neisseria gonorrhoeae]UYP52467.1 hypothetical protein ND436_002780 [Neisseria gonorrhoeae]